MSEFKAWRGHPPSEGSGKGSVPGLSPGFRWPVAGLGVPWLVDVPLRSPSTFPGSFPLCVCVFSSSSKDMCLALGPLQIIQDGLLMPDSLLQ